LIAGSGRPFVLVNEEAERLLAIIESHQQVRAC
jgi:hypothetical protein